MEHIDFKKNLKLALIFLYLYYEWAYIFSGVVVSVCSVSAV